MLPAWQWDEKQQIGTDYENVTEVEAYDRRMREVRDVTHVLGLRPSRAIASCRLAALGALPAEEAADDLRAAEPVLPRMDLVECRREMHRATGDAAWLEAAREVAEEILEQAPPERRAAMRTRVPVLRSVLAPPSGAGSGS